MLGHELTHIRNGDVRMLVIAVIIAGVIGFFAELLFRMMFQGGLRWGGGRSSGDSDRGKGGGGIAIIIAIALVAVAWLLSVVIRFALSRKREYLADAGSVELTKDPDAMISALRKIEGRGELQGATSAVMEMCIDNPREGFAEPVRHPSAGRKPDRGAGPVRRRPRSGPARTAGEPPAETTNRRSRTGRRRRRRRRTLGRRAEPPNAPPKPFLPSRAAGHARRRRTRRGPWGNRQG